MINAPLFAVIFLGMFWKELPVMQHLQDFRAVSDGTSASRTYFPEGATTFFKGGWIATVHTYPVEMAQNFWTAIIAFMGSTLLTVSLTLLLHKRK